MLWRPSAPTLHTPSTAPVPDAEALRRAALQASWRRGRWVARRRVAVRWLLWFSTRYLMPAALVAAVVAWLWLGTSPRSADAWPHWARWAGVSAPAQPTVKAPLPAPAPSPAATSPVAPTAPESATTPVEYSPEGEELATPLRLRFEALWNASAQAPKAAGNSNAGSPPPESASESSPQLKPENWLHSKEP